MLDLAGLKHVRRGISSDAAKAGAQPGEMNHRQLGLMDEAHKKTPPKRGLEMLEALSWAPAFAGATQILGSLRSPRICVGCGGRI